MKVVILAGGFGTRISEESYLKPKPMIEIGGQPILWHIMKHYSHYGFNDFIICCGYKQHVIKKFFADYYLHTSDVTFKLGQNEMVVHDNFSEPWNVTVVDTGLNTMTAGRIKRVQKYIGNETFMLTYGDGISDVNIPQLINFHHSHGKHVTMTTVNAGQRFGVLDVGKNGIVNAFREKDNQDGSLVNAGFMVIHPEFFQYIPDGAESDSLMLERAPLENAAKDGQIMAYKHGSFWKCMDTQRDKEQLELLWESGEAPWKVWE